MSRYPRAARNAAIKCIPCNAPVTKTADGEYVCVSCGDAPIQDRTADSRSMAAGAGD
jgi:predicted RNA-binding Zn-ribbon protein involved in translation (DUF1610 family)